MIHNEHHLLTAAACMALAVCVGGGIYMMSRNDSQKDEMAYKAAQAVIDGGEIWEEYPNEFISFGGDAGGISCWFEDLDMDGAPEFIVGPIVSGAHAVHEFEIWSCKNDSLEPFELQYYGEEKCSNMISLWYHYTPEEEYSDLLRSRLFKDKTTGEYLYVIRGADGNGSGNISYLSVLNGGKRLWENGRFSVSEYYSTSAGSLQTEYKANNYYTDSMEQLQENYKAFCENLVRYDFTTETFSFDAYSSGTESEKRELLMKSYNAFKYEESDQKSDLFLFDFS